MRKCNCFFALFIFLAAAMIFNAGLVRADVTGSVLGTVRDSSQAIVSGAHVTITNAQTNLKQETVSGADGTYRFLALAAGVYKLTVTAPGFKTYSTTAIDVKVNDQLQVDVTLSVGSATEVISIEANAVQVQTESTQLGDVIDSKKMLALPLNGRSFIDLLGLQAGVAPATAETIQQDRPVSGGLSAGNISVNGQRETANAFLVNGGDVSEGRNLGAGMVPNLDSIEEFRLITNSFDAEYGKFSGAVVNAITKSGTNSFHGDAFEFLRNDKLDAKNFFFGSKSELRRNQFGYAAGGPVWKNKIFWFSDYQGTREVKGAEASQVTVPTTDQRGGNFNLGSFETTDSNGNPIPTTVDGGYWAQVLSTRLGYSVTPGESYAEVQVPDSSPLGYHMAFCTSNTQCVFPNGMVPQTAWSAPSKAILPYIPAPTVAGVSANNYSNNSGKNITNDDKIGERIDFNNQRTGNWSWYYHFDRSNLDAALLPSSQGGFASVPGFPTVSPSRAQEFVMSNTKTLGATAVNEARFSLFRTALRLNNPAGSFAQLSDLGFNNANGLGIIPLAGYPQYVPQITFPNIGNNGLNIGVPTLNTFQPNTTYAVSDVFSKSQGKHTWKVGGEFRYLQVNERNFANPNGGFTFDGTVTGAPFADYLLGATSTTSAPYTQAAEQFLDSRTRYGGAFFQDSWKVKSNLTLNLGLRWEVSMPWYDTQGKIQTFVPGLQSTTFPLSPTGLVFPGDPGIPKTLAPTKYNNFGPRLGLAYSPGFSDGILGKIFGGPGKSSVRASYGLYYTSVEDLNLFYEVADAPFGLYWTSPVSVMFDEPFRVRATGASLNQRFPFTAPVPGAPSNQTLDFSVYEPFNFFPGYDIHNKLPYAEHFNLSIQRELTKSTVLTVAYVGTEGHRLITQKDANPGSAALCQQLTAENAIDVTAGGTLGCGPGNENDVFQVTPGAPCLPAAGQPFSPTPVPGCVYSTRQSILNPNFCPGGAQVCFGSNNTNTLTSANSIYNAAQITVERKANDFTFLAAYTFAKGLDDSSAFNDLVNFENPKLSRGLSSSDITHNFVVSYIWAVPFDRAFANAPKRLTQGWQIQGITRFSTGFPIQLNQGSDDISLAGSSATDMPDRVGPVVKWDPRKRSTSCDSYDPTAPDPSQTGYGCYFLTGAFAPNTTLGTFGTANRRFFHGPGFNNTDFGITKRTQIKENFAFDLRFEFFNIFNHAQFKNPDGNINDTGGFGVVTSARDPRIGQVSAKFYW
ncbi:MAG TPA: carboxypeptidase regulatory-like domain-containing protein [Candidatus Baltobacteraceae bacterium]|nr:carboxypeptidase regulatory-like domain-containing protein [Candidatus Baltobacteraceae bacterium]